MKKTLLVVALVSTASYAGWKLTRDGDGSPATTASDVKATDRVWIDKLPRSEREMFNVFLAITDESLGVFQTTSVWKGSYEAFQFEAHGNELRVKFPQDGAKEKLTVSARKCSEAGMDYCLEITGSSRGVKKYYSREGWEIDASVTADELDEQAQRVIQRSIDR